MSRSKILATFTLVGFALALSQCKQRSGESGLQSETGALPPKADKDTVTLVGLNDLHGNIRAKTYTIENGAERPKIRIGGIEALQAYFDVVRDYNPRTLLLDAGDVYQGSILSNYFQGLSLVDAYRHLKVDATTFGNHEFDYGPADSSPGTPNPDKTASKQGALLKIVAAASAPCGSDSSKEPCQQLAYLSANVATVADGPIHPAVTKSKVFVKEGIKIGVIGVTTTATPTQTIASNVVGVKFSKFIDSVPVEAERLRREEGVQLVVLLSHAGGDCDMANGQEARGRMIAFSELTTLPEGTPNGDVACKPNAAVGAADDEIMEFLRALPLEGKDGKPNLLATVDVVMAGHRHSSQGHFITNRDPASGKPRLNTLITVPVLQTTGFGKSFSMIGVKINRAASPMTPAAERIVGYDIHPQTYLCYDHFANFPDCNPELGTVFGFKKMSYPDALGSPVPPKFLGKTLQLRGRLPQKLSAMTAVFQPYLEQMKKNFGEIDRVVVKDLPKALPQDRNVESKMSNCVVDAVLEQYNLEHPDAPADLMIVNSSAVRDHLDDGEITFEMLFAISPFAAKIARMELTREEVDGLGESLSVNLPSAIAVISDGWKVRLNPAKKPKHQGFIFPGNLTGKEKIVVLTNDFNALPGGPHDAKLAAARAENRVTVPLLDKPDAQGNAPKVDLLELFEKRLKTEPLPASCNGAKPDRTVFVND